MVSIKEEFIKRVEENPKEFLISAEYYKNRLYSVDLDRNLNIGFDVNAGSDLEEWKYIRDIIIYLQLTNNENYADNCKNIIFEWG